MSSSSDTIASIHEIEDKVGSTVTNFTLSNSQIIPALVIGSMVVGALCALFWMVDGFRAMRAHERLAEATIQLAREARRDRGD